jgi:O-antigen/teichoic acid export membrane protein
MVIVSGLDLTIVGHYDYSQTAFYSIAILPTNFVVMIIGAIMGPLMPASSALSTQRTPAEMGEILARATRYSTIMLLLTGLPLIICGFPILHFWVGSAYAHHSLKYLQLLVVANILRNSCLPFATMMVATGKQLYGMTAAVAEAVVNLSASIYLAGHYGAAGVAVGTVLGAITTVALHFAVSMHFTNQTLSISRARLFLAGFLRPAAIAVPSVLVFLVIWSVPGNAPSISIGLVWALITACIAWFGSLNGDERKEIVFTVKRRLQFLIPAS